MLRSLVLSQRLLATHEVILIYHSTGGLHNAAAVRRVRTHAFLLHRDRVRGFVDEVESGHVREVSVTGNPPA